MLISIYTVFLPIIAQIITVLLLLVYGFIKKKKILMIFFILFTLWGNLIVKKDLLKEDKLYSLTIIKDGEKSKVIKIGKSFSKIKYNLYLELPNGRYEIKYRIINLVKGKYGYIIKGKLIKHEEQWFSRLKNLIITKIDKTIIYPKLVGFLKAVTLGEKSDLNKKNKDIFIKTGTAHILVISGLHIGIIILLCLKILEIINLSYRKKYIFTLFIITTFLFLVGFTPSIMRAYIMGAIYLISKLCFEKADIEKSYWLSVIIILIYNPLYILDIGFQMSFVSLFGIIYLYKWFKTKNRYLNIFILSLSIQLCLAPLQIYYFKTFPILSFLINIPAIFLGTITIYYSFLIILGCLVYCPNILIIIYKFLYDMLFNLVNLSQNIPMINVDIENNSIKIVFIYLLVLSLVIAGKLVFKKYIKIEIKKQM